jgi:hypothetical protein
MGMPCIEPDLSMTSTIAIDGFSFSCSYREDKGRTSSTGVR